MARQPNPAIREFILKNVKDHPSSISTLTIKKFGLSRTAINRYFQKLVSENLLTAEGKTNARHYKLKPIVYEVFQLDIDYLWTEDDLWRKHIAPLMSGVKQNIVDICHYGLTEMVNNVLDHASSPNILISYEQNYNEISIMVSDKGVGIFEKIQKDFNLSDPRTALLELSKGKLTSDKKRHAGEGIYLTSRLFDKFQIESKTLFYSRERQEEDDWLIELNDRPNNDRGTTIIMSLPTDASWTMQEVIDNCMGDNFRFRKTHVPVKLAQYPGEQLVSRSQAKRLLARFEHFSEVFLDFKNVDQIGQPFADELFRVFPNNNPNIIIQTTNTNDTVMRMIRFVREEEKTEPPNLFNT